MIERFHGGAQRTTDFSVNLNPLITERTVRAMLRPLAAEAMVYPEQRAESLVAALSQSCGVPPESIVAGNGSIELFYQLPAVLAPRRVFTLEPTFCEYRYVCELNRIPVERVAPAADFSWDLGALVPQLRRDDVLFICNPNNPTGGLFPKDAILAAAGSTAATVVVDEAFIDFAGGDASVVRDAARLPNLVVIKSLTKIYSIAGLRVGFCVASPGIIGRFRERLPLWNVNGPAAAVARAFLADDTLTVRTRAYVEREKRFLRRRLAALDGLRLFESRANFFIARADNAAGLHSFAASRGITLRRHGGFHGLDERHFRFAVRSRRDNAALVAVLEDYFGAGGTAR